MKLTAVERATLLNQFRILNLLEKGNWEDAVDVFEHGYELEYGNHLPDHETMSDAECTEVRDILSMFRALNHATSKERFRGFDGNHRIEGRYMGYVRHLWAAKQFNESHHEDIDGGNSHVEMLDRYRRMVNTWRGSGYPLTAAQVAAIESAAH